MLKEVKNEYIDYKDRPSRYMVDLNSELEKKNRNQEKDTRGGSKNIFFSRISVLFSIIFSIFKKVFVFLDKFAEFFKAIFFGLFSFSRRKKTKRTLGIKNNISENVLDSKIKRLAIFSFFAFLKKSFTSFSVSIFSIPVFIFKFSRKYLFFWIFPAEKKSLTAKTKELTRVAEYRPLKSALLFAFLLFVLVSPIKLYTFAKSMLEMKGVVLGISEDAVGDMAEAKNMMTELDFKSARENFDSAKNNFNEAKREIARVNILLTAVAEILPGEDMKMAANAQHILDAGSLSADLGNYLSLMMESISEEDRNIEKIIDSFYLNGKDALLISRDLSRVIEKINFKELPKEYVEKFALLIEASVNLEKYLEEFVDILEKAKIFLGFEYDKRYLLVFQNNTELRASGGFIGSYAVVDFRNGEIRKIDAPGGGSYDTEGGLRERIVAPKPLHLVNPLWHFWDANWWPDWKKSAEKLMWFYEKSGGTTVDGVISFTPTTMEIILEAIGPVDMSENYGVVIDNENFWLTVQSFAEQKQDITNEPKKIVGDMFYKILEVLPERIDKEMFLNLVLDADKTFSEKQTLLYFKDEVLQRKAEDLDWAGRMKDSAWDYLMVVNSNIAGAKSDKKIKEEIEHETSVREDGSIINTLKIKRTHNGQKNEIFSGVRNVNWMRVYVPLGSKLIEASGFDVPDNEYFEAPEEWWDNDPQVKEEESATTRDLRSGVRIYNESAKTVFANWSMVDPGETIEIIIKYKLPMKFEISQEENNKKYLPYSLLAQKQPGSIGSSFNSKLRLPSNLQAVWSYPDDFQIGPAGWNVEDNLKVDLYRAILIEKK